MRPSSRWTIARRLTPMVLGDPEYLEMEREALRRQAVSKLTELLEEDRLYTVRIRSEWPDEHELDYAKNWDLSHELVVRYWFEVGEVPERPSYMLMADVPPPSRYQKPMEYHALGHELLSRTAYAVGDMLIEFVQYFTAERRQQEINIFCGREPDDGGSDEKWW